MRRSKLWLAATLLMASITSYASPYFTIVKSDLVSFPSTVLTHHNAVGDYVITNVSTHGQAVYIHNLPTGFSLIDDANASPRSCGTDLNFHLAVGESCSLRLAYHSDETHQVAANLPTVCPTASSAVGCEYPTTLTSFVVAVTDPNHAAELSSDEDSIYFAPGETTYVTVTNTGTATVNNATIELPDPLEEYLSTDAIITCTTIAPGESCTFRLPMDEELPVDMLDAPLAIESANAEDIEFNSHVASNLLALSSAVFNEAGGQHIHVVNHESTLLTQLRATLGAGTTHVSLDSDSSTCGDSLAAGASCDYVYQAATNASGHATVTVSGNQNGQSKSATTTITVNSPSIVINQGQDIQAENTGSFSVTNTGQFDAQSIRITHSPEDTWLTLGTSRCSNAIKAGESCQVDYVIHDKHDLSSVITVSGSNFSDTQQDFEPNHMISLGAEGDETYQHLRYHALRITNLTSVNQQLSAITAKPPASLADNISLCDATGSNCDNHYASDCLTRGKSLSPNEHCHIWYRANTHDHLKPTTPAQADIAVTATTDSGDTHTLTKSIQFSYGNHLYAAGRFTQAGELEADHIAKWDGQQWQSVATGIDGRVNHLTSNGSDLYAGGAFTDAGDTTVNNLARWNGLHWSALDNGVNKQVYALAAARDNLYVGGRFSRVGPNNLKAKRIAKWDGSQWSTLGKTNRRSVLALAVDDTNVYATGRFNRIGGTHFNNVAKWDGNQWSALGNGLDGKREKGLALLLWNHALFVGGQFSKAGNNDASGFAKWENNSWQSLATDNVRWLRTFATDGNTLYAGGYFHSEVYGRQVFHSLAKWDGSNWVNLDTSKKRRRRTFALAANGQDVYLGGLYKNVGQRRGYDYLEKWAPCCLTVIDPGFNSSVLAITVMPQLSLR